MKHHYLGDAVYVEFNGYHVKLTTFDGIEDTNTIYLEPEVLDALLMFIKSLNRQEPYICGFCGQPGADKIPHPIYWPAENSAGTAYVHAKCEDVECRRASDLCQGKEREEFLRNV